MNLKNAGIDDLRSAQGLKATCAFFCESISLWRPLWTLGVTAASDPAGPLLVQQGADRAQQTNHPSTYMSSFLSYLTYLSLLFSFRHSFRPCLSFLFNPFFFPFPLLSFFSFFLSFLFRLLSPPLNPLFLSFFFYIFRMLFFFSSRSKKHPRSRD